MPLRPGCDRETISANIRKLRHEGYPPKQAVAISLRNARETCGGRKRERPRASSS